MASSSRFQSLLRFAGWTLPAALLLGAANAWAGEAGGAAGSFSMLDAAKILLTHGGIFPYLNIGVAGLSIAIVVERAIRLNQYSVDGESFMTSIVQNVRQGKIDTARRYCAAFPKVVLARVMKAGLDSSNRGEAEIATAMEESTLELSPLVSKRIPALFPLANIATLIGLIGTISGLIKCFSALGAAAAAEKQTILSRGISEAMYNTAFGLMIAVTCIGAQLWLATKAKHMLEEVEFNALKLENLLGRRLAGELQTDPAAN